MEIGDGFVLGSSKFGRIHLGSNLCFLLLNFFVEPHGHKLGKWGPFSTGNAFQQSKVKWI